VADYRMIYTHIYRDEWFLELEPDAKLLFIYLFSNDLTSVSGLYKIPRRVMAFETGLALSRVDELLEHFRKQDKVEYEDGYVWVKNMRRYQFSQSPKILKGIQQDIARTPDCAIKRRYLASRDAVSADEAPTDEVSKQPSRTDEVSSEAENSDRVSIPYPYGSEGIPTKPYKDNDIDIDRDTDNAQTKPDTTNVGAAAPAPSDPEADSDPLVGCISFLNAPTTKGQERPRALAKLYRRRFGETVCKKYPPNYGRLGALAKQLSGDYVALAEMIWSLSVPSGNPHDYLQRCIDNSAQKKREPVVLPDYQEGETPPSMQHAEKTPGTLLWETVSGQLKCQMPRATYDTWIRDAVVIAEDDAVLTVRVGNQQALDWINGRLKNTIIDKTWQALAPDRELRFVAQNGHGGA
jgi:hypothetical protein